ncbi:MAG: transketolase family protein [Candidatus Zixiibacteriota bacterium]
MAIKMEPTRIGFGKALEDLGHKYDNLVVLGADITGSVKTSLFKDAHPERFFSMGIAEQDAAATAAGMAIAGLIPVFSTYGIFASGRAWEQIRTSVAYSNVHVIIGGAHGGITVGPDGATHQALEELTLMRAIPNMTVLCPADSNETYNATAHAIENLDGPCYIRFGRAASEVFTEKDDPFEIGKAKIFRDGKDITLIGTGAMIYQCILASDTLKKEGISARVLGMHTIKPIDEDAIIKAASETGKIITVEEHQVTGGLGGAVSEVIVQNNPVPMRFIGMQDRFGQSGEPGELLEYYHLTAKHIAQSARDFIKA